MTKPLVKQKWATILLASLAVVNCAGFTPPPSWTLRADGRVRASQRNEDFSVQEFIAKIKKEEGEEHAIVVTPKGEADISREIIRLRAKVKELEERCN